MKKTLIETLAALALGLLAALLIAVWQGFPITAIVNLALLWLIVSISAFLYIRSKYRRRY